MLALLLGITSSGHEWYTTSSIDPIDDTRSAVALRLERPGQWTRAGRHRLLLLFCKEQRPNEKPDLHAAVAWNLSAEDLSKPVDENRQDESRTTMGILTRFGDEQARSWTYERVGKGKELFVTIPLDRDRFLEETKRATEVAMRLEHEVKGTQTTVFDLAGSARVIKAMEGGCNSPSESRVPLNARRQQEAAPTPRAEANAPAALTGPLRRTITDAIKQKVERNWSVPAGVFDAGELVVTLRVQLGPDGSVRRVETVDDGGGASYRTMAESARRAVLKASPFDVLTRYVDKYEGWRDITITFSPPV
ncbi:MAG: cell envelope integrity protein TolA [bacterium]|nr:cell envelope integrity protein TolA [bacterium]